MCETLVVRARQQQGLWEPILRWGQEQEQQQQRPQQGAGGDGLDGAEEMDAQQRRRGGSDGGEASDSELSDFGPDEQWLLVGGLGACAAGPYQLRHGERTRLVLPVAEPHAGGRSVSLLCRHYPRISRFLCTITA